MKTHTPGRYGRLAMLSLLLLILALSLHPTPVAQAVDKIANYNFTAISGTFTPLTGANIIKIDPLNDITTAGDADDGHANSRPIGFNFKYLETTYNQFGISTNGWLTLGSGSTNITDDVLDNTPGATGGLANQTANNIRPIIAPLWDDLDSVSGSLSYQTSGSPGNRILTVEWLNMEWDFDANVPVISFQVKLYEANGQVEFVYRSEAAAGNPGGKGGATIGLSAPATGDYLSLNNTSTSPTASSTIETANITTKPATGQIYRFSPPVFIYVAAVFKDFTNTGKWVAQTSGTAQTLNGISCPDVNTCIAVGNAGTILTTTNGGTTWTPRASSTANNLNGVDCLNTNICVAAGDAGTIVRTTDGGATWGPVASGTAQVLRGVGCATNTCLAVGGTGVSIGAASINGGSNWLAANLGNTNLFGSSCPNDGTCTTVGDGGRTLVIAGPIPPAIIRNLPDLGVNLKDTDCIGDNCYSVGDNGEIQVSIDKGVNWSKKTSGTANILRSLDCPAATTCFTAGDNGTILTTTNTGGTWAAETSNTVQALRGISCPTTAKCFAVGNNGTILTKS